MAESFAASSVSSVSNIVKIDSSSEGRTVAAGSSDGGTKTTNRTAKRLRAKFTRWLSACGIVSFRSMDTAARRLTESCNSIECTLQKLHESRQDV